MMLASNSRVLLLLYIACVISSFASSVVAPPERNFNQGQPELQQAMDNMIFRDEGMKESYPSSDDTKSLIYDRTTHILDEAENMMSIAEDMQEREWLKHFVRKLKMLASILEQDAANHTRGNQSNSFATAQSLSNSTDPDGYFPQQNSSDFKSKTVPGPGQMKPSQMTSKFPVTLPEMNQLKSKYAIVDHVTKSIMTPSRIDPLVKELESLHKLSLRDQFDGSTTAPETSSTSVEISTQSSLIEERNEDQEKERLKERISNEVAELKRLGETEENILNAMHIEGFKSFDSEDKAKESPSDHIPVKRVLDPLYWNRPANHLPEPPRQIYMNNTFLGMHITLPPVNPQVLRRQFHYGLPRAVNNYPLYNSGFIQNLQTQSNPQKNRVYGIPKFMSRGRPDQQLRPGGINPYGISAQSHTRYSPNNPAPNPYVYPNFKSYYMEYPVNQNMEQRSNIVVNDTKSTTYSLSKLPAEFNEEMKRQLRDGKVILLSDSIVSSNFTSDAENARKESKPENE